MPSYNHAPFITEAINSVLNQSFDDFELLIEDDGSKDGSREIISAIKDERINFVGNEINQGAGFVTRNLINRARGEYIALINSDDRWFRDKLQIQNGYMDNNPEVSAIFSKVTYIDQAGRGISKDSFVWGGIFDKENRSRAQWLRHLMFHGNCLCNPSVLIKSAVFKDIGVYDNRMRQLPDFDLWIRFSKKYNFHILDQELIEFRILQGEANASGDTKANSVRVINEYMLIMETFFDGIDKETLIEGFEDLLRIKDIPTDIHLEIEKVLLLFCDAPWLDHMFKIVGIKKLYDLLGIPVFARILQDDYQIGVNEFHKMVGDASAFRP